MKIDYLKEGVDDRPIVRLYEFRSADAQRLRQTFQALAGGSTQQVRLEDIGAVESVDGTRLTFSRGNRDRGVVHHGADQFEVVLTSQGWQQAADLTEAFCEPSTGYQWLTPHTGKIQLLLSLSGDW